jgi:hypothetical protein
MAIFGNVQGTLQWQGRSRDDRNAQPKQTRKTLQIIHAMTTTQMLANDLESYLERRYERAIDRLDRKYLESDMSEYEYQNEVEMLKVQVFQCMVSVCNLENQ